MAGTILQSDFFMGLILPFVLVFVVVFAILQKTKILGEGKKQIDALVALVVGLIVVGFGYSVHIIVYLSAFLAVAVVIILVFMILTGSFYEPGKFELHKNVKYAGMGLVIIAVVIAVLYFTGAWDYLLNFFKEGGNANSWVANIIMILIIIVAVAAVLFGGGGKGDGKSGEK